MTHRAARHDLHGIHLAALMLAGTALFAKLIPLPALDITALRGGIAALALLLVLLISRSRIALPSARHYLAMAVGGVLFAIHWMTYFKSMQVSTVAVGVVALLTFPVITTVLEPLFERRLPTRARIAAGLVVLAGVALIGQDSGLGGNVPLGLGLGVFSATIYSLRNLLQRHFLQGVSGAQVMLYQSAITAMVFAPFVGASTLQAPLPVWALLLLLGTVFTAVPHTLITHGLRRLNATTVSFVLALQIPYATVMAAVLLAEVPGPLALAGGALVVAGSVYATASGQRAPAPAPVAADQREP